MIRGVYKKVVELSNLRREFQLEFHQSTVQRMAAFKIERLHIFGWETIWKNEVTLFPVGKRCSHSKTRIRAQIIQVL
jgi:hypothetical protein